MQRLRTEKTLHRRGRLYLPAILVAVIAAYYPTFQGEFILDDLPFVKDNPMIQEIQPLASYFLQEDGIVPDQAGRTHSGYYRPLINLTYSIDHVLWGPNGAGFRTSNLIFHLITCILLYMCAGRLLKEGAAPLLAVLIFGIHPANTESVAWVSSRNNILVTLFSVTSFYFYIRRTEEHKTWQGMLCLLFFALALLSKEFATMLLPIFLVYDRVVGGKKGFLRRGVWGYAAFVSILAAYLLLRKAAIPHMMPVVHSIGDFRQALFFSPYLLMENLKIILIPAGLHNFMIGYPDSFLSKEAVLGFASVSLLIGLMWRWRTHRFFLFSSISFLLALFPVLNLLPTSAYSLVSMRWLYFPMVFLSFSAAWVLGRIETNGRFFYVSIASAVVLYLGTYTYVLNENLWKTEPAFFEKEVVNFGNHFYAADLARIHHLRGEYGEAQRFYREAVVSGSPARARLLINYAALLVESNQPEAALGYLAEAENLNPEGEYRGILWNNRGAARFKMKDYKGAAVCFEKAVAFSPEQPSYRINLGRAYATCGQDEQAAVVERGCRPARGLHFGKESR